MASCRVGASKSHVRTPRTHTFQEHLKQLRSAGRNTPDFQGLLHWASRGALLGHSDHSHSSPKQAKKAMQQCCVVGETSSSASQETAGGGESTAISCVWKTSDKSLFHLSALLHRQQLINAYVISVSTGLLLKRIPATNPPRVSC